MPVCPGCERRVSYEQLPVHERYCRGLRSNRSGESDGTKHLERQLMALEERLAEELHSHDEEIKSRLQELERTQIRPSPE